MAYKQILHVKTFNCQSIVATYIIIREVIYKTSITLVNVVYSKLVSHSTTPECNRNDMILSHHPIKPQPMFAQGRKNQ